LHQAEEKRVAVGHFNISDITALRSIFNSARKLEVPVIIGVSEGERDFVGVSQAAALVSSFRHEYNYPIFLNADHTHSIEKIKEAAIAGFDQIIIDYSNLPLSECILTTKDAVSLAKSINPNVVLEGEIGFIGTSSEVMDKIPEGLELTKPEDAKKYMNETQVDVLAPAVGNMHGLLKSMASGKEHKHLQIELIKDIKQAISGKFMTLHGGSGTADEDFVAAIKAGMTIVHVNTEIRIAWRKGVEEAFSLLPQEVAPYKLLPKAEEKISEVVENRLRLFNS
jgi:fructose-bisphosphate aldolase class II